MLNSHIFVAQYANFKRDVFQNDKDIQSPIKQNKIPIFKFHRTKEKSATAKKLKRLKNDVCLCSCLIVAHHLRERDTTIFFSHENQLYRPSMYDQGIQTKKFNIIKCIKSSVVQDKEIVFHYKTFDGGALLET